MSNQVTGVRLQNLRDFTVQIRHTKTDAIVGTGIAVSTDGRIVTCAHVVVAAGVNPRTGKHIRGFWAMIRESIFRRKPGTLTDAEKAEVGAFFPKVSGRRGESRRATVLACFRQHDDDVVLLQLVEGPSPLAPEQIAELGTAEESAGHDFQSFGYRRLAKYQGLPAEGRIVGCGDRPTDKVLQCNPIMLGSQHIDSGMSGAAVLDVARNLVVGVIAETWDSRGDFADRDTNFAVDARVLTFDPLNLPVRDEDLPKRTAPQPKTDIAAARAAVAPDLGIEWNNPPAPLEEWVGREDLLTNISADWADPQRRVTGLIGFGGEGKSSLVRRWLDNLLADPSQPQSDGVFWWGFYTRPSVDEFFEAALGFMSGGKIDPRDHPSANAKAHFIAGMFYAGRYLFVLDGLEVMQHQEGDQYGLLRSGDLREFLSYFAAPGHQSFCLITSRAPVMDLMEYTTYTHRDVTRLRPADGRALLRKVGVQGDAEALDKVVVDWGGHALTLGLLGGHLASQYGGDLAYASEIDPPTADEPRYERVHRVLRRYDEYLNDAEQTFLTLFSAFRTPVEETAFDKVFRADMGADALNAPVAVLDAAAFDAMVQRLLTYRILRHDPRAGTYTAHPLIRNHYLAHLTAGDPSTGSGQAAAQDAHERIKDYYLELAGDTPHNPTLDDLAPLIEVVHHACRAGAYDEAHRIQRERIYQDERRVLAWQLGAYETALALMAEFFPDADTSQEPQVSDPNSKGFILNEVGLCLMGLGRLGEAVLFYERSNAIAVGMEDWHNASRGYINLAELHAHLGAPGASADAAREAMALARRAENKKDEMLSSSSARKTSSKVKLSLLALHWQAWAAHLRGDLEAAGTAFQQAEVLEQEIGSTVRYLYSNRGIFHADHLRRTGDADYARRVTEANLEICERNRWPDTLSQCHRVLGDLDADAGEHDSARAHYDEARKIARGITFRPALIEALLARGRWNARHLQDSAAAFNDLNEALGYVVDGGYRIYEADIRIGLAWAHYAAGNASAARAEAEHARNMSTEMGYHWGQVDADEVLAALDQSA